MMNAFCELQLDQQKTLKGTNMLLDVLAGYWFLEWDLLLIFTLNYFQSNKVDRRKCYSLVLDDFGVCCESVWNTMAISTG